MSYRWSLSCFSVNFSFRAATFSLRHVVFLKRSWCSVSIVRRWMFCEVDSSHHTDAGASPGDLKALSMWWLWIYSPPHLHTPKVLQSLHDYRRSLDLCQASWGKLPKKFCPITRWRWADTYVSTPALLRHSRVLVRLRWGACWTWLCQRRFNLLPCFYSHPNIKCQRGACFIAVGRTVKFAFVSFTQQWFTALILWL